MLQSILDGQAAALLSQKEQNTVSFKVNIEFQILAIRWVQLQAF